MLHLHHHCLTLSTYTYNITNVLFLFIDNGPAGSRRTGTATVFVEVQDVNDNRPIFLQNSYETSILENVPQGTSILQVKTQAYKIFSAVKPKQHFFTRLHVYKKLQNTMKQLKRNLLAWVAVVLLVVLACDL